MSRKLEVLALEETVNCPVIRMPNRSFPGILMQGDTLNNMYGLVKEIRRNVKESNWEEVKDIAVELDEMLSVFVSVYESSLKKEGYELPYNKAVEAVHLGLTRTALVGRSETMTVPIPDSHKRLLTDPIIAHLATIMPDGRPQVHPVWCDYDGTYVRVNAATDRQKGRNMRHRKFATILLADGPYFWMEIRGRVVASTTEGAMAHMHGMAKKYTGRETYTPVRDGEVRVMYTIAPERIVTFGT